ncbi:MAG: flavin reductase family protein [Candidatus Scatomorpha sp.]|jgi:flavin reductase (DIM6/NTAB) family NADH-FMN oxidoreductase RutF
MHYDTKLNNHGLKADPFKACVGPRPIAWISTVSKDGRDNLAPFSQFNNLSFDPPMVMVSFQHGGGEEDSHRKDTLNNIEETGYFVYNIVPYELREKMNITAFPGDGDEFELAGLTKADCIQVPCKRVAESPIQFECEYMQTIHIPSKSNRGIIDMVLGRVLEVHIADEVLTDGKVDFMKIKPLGRLGYWDYTYVNEVFSMAVPGLNAKQMASMGGDRTEKK